MAKKVMEYPDYIPKIQRIYIYIPYPLLLEGNLNLNGGHIITNTRVQKLCSIQIENKVPLDISFLITKSQIEDKRRGELDFQMNRISLFTFISSQIADTSL